MTGASAGLGARFARVLHQAGAHVLATARRADLLDQLAGECGERIDVMPGDITDASRRQALTGRLAGHGRLDVLVSNAGICDDGPIEQQSLDELRRVIQVNLVSVLDLGRLTAPLLLAAPAASVINVASMYGIVASRGPMAACNAAKGALVSLTRQLAAQWGQRGVRVNALAPGYFPTELTGHLADAGFARSIREHTLLARTPARGDRRPPAVPGHRRLQLHDRPGPGHRRRLDRSMSRNHRMNGVGEPCAGEPHARFEAAGAWKRSTRPWSRSEAARTGNPGKSGCGTSRQTTPPRQPRPYL